MHSVLGPGVPGPCLPRVDVELNLSQYSKSSSPEPVADGDPSSGSFRNIQLQEGSHIPGEFPICGRGGERQIQTLHP